MKLPLARLRLANFQKHVKKQIVFDQSVTTIVGPTDRGKSAILRALRWVLTNTPSGSGFIRHGKEKCRADVVVNGHTVSRRRGKSLNTYHLDGEKLSAFGQGVPDNVLSAANIDPDVNLQSQHHPYFWLSMPPSQVSKELNRFVALDKADAVVDWLHKKNSLAATELRTTKARKEKAYTDYDEQYVDTQELEEALSKIEDDVAELEKLQANANMLKLTSLKLTKVQSSITAQVQTIALCKQAEKKLASKVQELESQREAEEALAELIGSVEALEIQRKDVQRYHDKLSAEFEKLNKGRCPLCQK